MHKVLVIPSDLLDAIGTSSSTMNIFMLVTRTAETAEEALALAREWRPALVLFDGHLEGMSAADFCRAVRADRSLDGTRLLLLARRIGSGALGQLGDAWESLAAAEPDGLLVPPVDKVQLVATMAGLIGIGQQRPVATDCLVALRGDGGVAVLATAIQVSEAGLRVEAASRLEVGAWLTAAFALPEVGFAITARCAVQCLIDAIRLRYELRFVQIDSSDQQALCAYIQAATGEVP